MANAKAKKGSRGYRKAGDGLDPLPASKALDTTFGMPKIVPRTKQHQRLCEEIAKGTPVYTAAIAVGYKPATANRTAYDVARRYEDYIQWLIAHQAQAKSKQIAIELEPVLQEVAKIAFANEYDYLVVEPAKEPGQPPTVRRKRLDELTREQMIPIQVFRCNKATGLDYKLRDKEGRLIDLIKHLGGFSEKIILEHRHRHLHAHVDLTDVPLEQLEAIEANMQKLLTGRVRGSTLEVK